MNIADVTCGARAITLTWDDHSVAEYPYVWLRDNDPSELHPQARERVFDLTTVDLDIRPSSHMVEGGSLIVNWPGKTGSSTYPGDWLYRHQPGRPRHDAAFVPQSLWDRETLTEIPRYKVSTCNSDKDDFKNALLTLKQIGIAIFDGLVDSPAAGESFGDRIGIKRETNFGKNFEVVSRVEPNNLAYTALGLPLHTDLPNQEVVPGFQFLHCVTNSAAGGESIFADGFRICADLRATAPEDFEILTRVRVPFRFHDDEHDIRQHRPIISMSDNGDFERIVFNTQIADVPDFGATEIYEYYRAYRNLMVKMREPRFSIRLMLKPGEMVGFNNGRVLHGRTAFDPESGERHFRGFYIERNEIDDRIRVLARN